MPFSIVTPRASSVQQPFASSSKAQMRAAWLEIESAPRDGSAGSNHHQILVDSIRRSGVEVDVSRGFFRFQERASSTWTRTQPSQSLRSSPDGDLQWTRVCTTLSAINRPLMQPRSSPHRRQGRTGLVNDQFRRHSQRVVCSTLSRSRGSTSQFSHLVRCGLFGGLALRLESAALRSSFSHCFSSRRSNLKSRRFERH